MDVMEDGKRSSAGHLSDRTPDEDQGICREPSGQVQLAIEDMQMRLKYPGNVAENSVTIRSTSL